MRVRLFALLAVLSLAAVPSPARSAEAKKAAKPAAVGQFQSIDEIMADIKYLAALAGHEEEAEHFDGIIKSQIGEKGLQGIDTKKPWGFYNMVVGTPGTVLVPISDEKAKEKIRQEILDPILKDNCRARDLGSDGNYVRRAPVVGEPPLDGQQAIIDRLSRRGLHAVPDEGNPSKPE